jgi:hypothetical protein
MKPDFPYRFAQTMSKAETTAFKASEHLTKGKWSTQRTLLFTTMLNMDINDLTSVEKALTAEPDYIRVLTVEKHRMLRAMIACVLDLRQRRENQADPWELLRESQLLLDMGLSEEAALKAAEGIAVAEKVDDLYAELQLREHLRASYKLIPRINIIDQITENEYRLETLIQKVANLNRYAIICDNIGDHQKKYRVSDDQAARAAMDALMADPLMSGLEKATSLPSQIRYTTAKAFYLDSIGKLDQAQDEFYNGLTLWETNPERIAYLPHFYRQALANLIGLLIRSKKTDQVPILLKRMEQVPIAGRRAAMLAFCDVELQYQFYYLNTQQFEQVINRETEIINGIRNFGKLMMESKELSLLYNLAISHLIVGNNKTAKSHFTTIRNKGNLHSRIDLQGLSRIFRLLILLEEDKDERFLYHLRSYKRTFRKGMPFYSMENVIYNWLKKHALVFHTPESKHLLMQLHAQLAEFETQRLIGAEELRLWVRSRASGKSIKEVMSEKSSVS